MKMPRRASKRKAESPANLTASDISAPSIAPVQRRTRSSATKPAQRDGGRRGKAADSTKDQSRLTRFEKSANEERRKTKEFFRSYEKKVNEECDAVLNRLEQVMDDVGKNDEDLITACLSQTYKPANISDGTADNSFSQAKSAERRHPLFEQGLKILRLCDDILDKFDEASKILLEDKSSIPSATWKENREGLSKILAAGKTYGENLVESVVVPKTEHQLADIASPPEAEKEVSPAVLFGSSRSGLAKGTWANVVRSQVQALTSALKTVPLRDADK